MMSTGSFFADLEAAVDDASRTFFLGWRLALNYPISRITNRSLVMPILAVLWLLSSAASDTALTFANHAAPPAVMPLLQNASIGILLWSAGLFLVAIYTGCDFDRLWNAVASCVGLGWFLSACLYWFSPAHTTITAIALVGYVVVGTGNALSQAGLERGGTIAAAAVLCSALLEHAAGYLAGNWLS